MRLDFDDGTYIVEDKSTDTFFVGFNDYLFLRKSCYICKYSGEKRISDFTIADYWGVDETEVSKENLNYGVSLILVNSRKGKLLLSQLNNTMVLKRANREKAIKNNQALSRSSSINAKREHFFRHFRKNDFDRLIHKYNKGIYIKKWIRERIGEKQYQILKKIFKSKD